LLNVWIVPAFGLFLPLLLGSTILALLSGWFEPLAIIARFLDWGMFSLQSITTASWVILDFPTMPLWISLCAIAGILILLMPRGLPGRWVSLPLILVWWLWQPIPIGFGSFRVTVLDVGQGLAAIVQTRKHTLVYDTGPMFPSGFNTGTVVVVPTLRAYGVKRVDSVIISHGDRDHAGGLQGLVAEIPVVKILSGEPQRIATINSITSATSRNIRTNSHNLTTDSIVNIDAQQCKAGQNWTWDGVQFAILAPKKPFPIVSNDLSCVLHIKSSGGSILFTGDLGGIEELIFAAHNGKKLQSQVLIAGHHGSANSTSKELLAQVQPKWVIVSAGYRNRFKFPRPKMVKRVWDIGAKLASTSHSGAIQMHFDAKHGLQDPILYRKHYANPWTHQPIANFNR